MQALIDRLSACGVAHVEWVDIEGVPVAVGSGVCDLGREGRSNIERIAVWAQAVIMWPSFLMSCPK